MSETKRQIGHKLQYAVMIPMFLGIFICSAITVLLLNLDYKSWVENTEAFIKDNEKNHLKMMSSALNKNFEIIVSDVILT